MAGESMCNLNEADGRAVDVFFAIRSDSERETDPEGSTVSAAQLERVAKVLAPLDELFAPEPPRELAQRTIRIALRRSLGSRLSAPGEDEMGQIWNAQI